ncbi:MAG: MarR family transcriptional regulator [Bifidobacteriaceae bacterium]|jgi:biotin operon repressor|nr:MarR family transcriptional regulator [Bifidobacteriaceae bacterium]
MNGRLPEPDSALSLLLAEVDESAEVGPLSLKGILSVAVASRYNFRELTLLGERYVLAAAAEPFTVDRLVADFAAIEAKTGQPVIALAPELSPYFRKALIARRVPFLLGGKQAFLPFVYLNLAASKPARQPGEFAPATRLVFLVLLYADGAARAQDSLGSALGLSPMSVSRAVEQLTAHGLIEVAITGRTGRRRVIQVPDSADYYRLGMRHFGRAVKQTIHLAGRAPEGLPRSGLDALSARTLLSAPGHPSYAAGFRRRREFANEQIGWRDALDREDSYRLDLLSYDPSVLAVDGLVDPVTMAFTVGEHDERIDQALDDYLGGFPWYSD